MLRKEDYGRYLACLYLGAQLREAAFSLYAFDVEISAIATHVSDPMPGEIRLQWWRDALQNSGVAAGNPVAMAVNATITKHNLPLHIFDALLNARIFDLYSDPMTSRNMLEGWLGETHSSLFQLLCLVAGEGTNGEMADACGHSGVFCGVVNLLKALPVHHYRQQNYFPTELSSHQRMDRRKPKEVSKIWLADIIEYSQEHRVLANKAIGKLPVSLRSVFLPNALAQAQLQILLRHGIDTSVAPVSPSRLKINWCLWKAARSGVY